MKLNKQKIFVLLYFFWGNDIGVGVGGRGSFDRRFLIISCRSQILGRGFELCFGWLKLLQKVVLERKEILIIMCQMRGCDFEYK